MPIQDMSTPEKTEMEEILNYIDQEEFILGLATLTTATNSPPGDEVELRSTNVTAIDLPSAEKAIEGGPTPALSSAPAIGIFQVSVPSVAFAQ